MNGEQHDFHCRLVYCGQDWTIARISGSRLTLTSLYDTGRVVVSWPRRYWEAYAARARRMEDENYAMRTAAS